MKKIVVVIIFIILLNGISFSMGNDDLSQDLLREVIQYNLPGAIVAVVKDGEPVFAEAFGKSSQQPMDLNDTIIQTGSISRVLTSYALLQLMNLNEIDLEEPIAPYLPEYLQNHAHFNVLTFNHVLTHTSGIPSLKKDTARQINPLDPRDYKFSELAKDFLTSYKHESVIEPGRYVMLSNVNNILAGVLIESISGLSYESYMSRRLLRPIGMRTSAEIILGNAPVAKNLAQPYSVFGGRNSPMEPFQAKHLVADDFLTTGEDMINLMVKMQRKNYGIFESRAQNSLWMPGRSAGFSIVNYRGVEVFLQDGGIPGANSRLLFIPSYDLSIFLYYNSDGLEAKDALMNVTIDHFLNLENYTPALSPYQHFGLSQFSGVFLPLNVSGETIERLTQVIHQVRVTSLENGIMIDKEFYEPISETVFFNANLNQFVEFKSDSDGKLAHLVIGNQVYKKAPIYQSKLIEMTLLILTFSINLLVLLIMLFKWHDLKLHRIHDTPRVLLLVHVLTITGLLSAIVVVATQYNFWNVVFNNGAGLVWVKILGWINALFVIPIYLVLKKVKEDFRWSSLIRFLFTLHWLMGVAVFIWLWRYHLV